ncbi:hypothetical protein L284_05320 [Novosphingobium lindaniclasticum LE124]|uniref:Uncharacterized protein n=1 Tax=Novosphingobium lindaniclasticum LE124 TaxID=1096930 RepID=T0HYH8_9SPHN|nr:hypothetical protein L284_05320 [Novosphingobium lindaniclasticum LE124]
MERIGGGQHGFRPLATRLLQPGFETVYPCPREFGDVILVQAFDPRLEFLDMFAQRVMPPLVDNRLVGIETEYPVETEWLNGHGILHHRRTLGIRERYH